MYWCCAAQRFAFVGDVRGSGLMIGVEIVDNKASKKPAPSAAAHIKEAMVARHVLLAVDGPHANVVKIKPPMVFAEPECDHLIAELTQVTMAQLTLQLFDCAMERRC